ncbi:MAG: hypothetical protein AAGK26_03955 [Pseudomonadota bacterium]
MPQYNDLFELSIDDMHLIEEALRQTIASKSLAELDESPDDQTARQDTVRRMHDLLGRLHDQKIFYRPKSGFFVGG